MLGIQGRDWKRAEDRIGLVSVEKQFSGICCSCFLIEPGVEKNMTVPLTLVVGCCSDTAIRDGRIYSCFKIFVLH